ncbi:TIM-barrel protein, putative [Haloplanus vescus]|uniref:TIM-barrel protein, putative n=1 Tax=Haloplanus vescus TaxID=555874 RepID=A0A1H3VT71_9EURY|nr:tRNA-dihydrouridine synthase [Haloplanus vescus]SDZ77881.1 TIM-barrel protein, putative [Haloplanus vescus]
MLALASLSGESDAEWARAGAAHADLAFLGGVAVDDASREAARQLVARGREEFLPEDPIAFVDRQLTALDDAPIRAGVNVRSATLDPIRAVAARCAAHDAVIEINAHCRQDELCAVGCGERLLRDTDRLADYVAAASETGATVSVKVRAEVAGVDLPATARRLDDAGADIVHVDAMDSEPRVADVAAVTDAAVLANNGVRDRATAWEYLAYGADGVSVGRPSDDPAVLQRVARAVDDWTRRDTGERGAFG